MSAQIDVSGGADPLLTAAIIAAVARLEEERMTVAGSPARRPSQGRWVLSGRPREVAPPVVRASPQSEGWSLASDDQGEPEA